MGFFSSSAKQGAADGQAGAQTQEGHSNAINLSAGDDIKYAVINVSNKTSDFGAIDKAFDFAQDVASGSVEAVASLAEKVLDFSHDTVDVLSTNNSQTIKAVGILAGEISDASASENSKLTDTLAKYGIGGALLITGLFIWKNKK